jgi:lipoyl(octanoyl) transferase
MSLKNGELITIQMPRRGMVGMETDRGKYRLLVRLIGGLVDYRQAWRWQQQLVAERSAGDGSDTLLLLEHPPTITLGRAAHREHILFSPDDLARQGIDLVESDRGGDVTYHAPGQLVGYPVLKLAHYGGNVLRYLRNLEEVLIRTLATYGIAGRRVEGLTGVWVGLDGETPTKIAAIGVRLSASGITSHGFALNVAPEMRGFQTIIPCGIQNSRVTSLEQLLGGAPPMEEVATRVVAHFAEVFGIDPIETIGHERYTSIEKDI